MSWKKTGAGYSIETSKGTATVEKTGKTWTLRLGSESWDLGRRASFDHAEGTLRQVGAL